ncbi:MAG: metalloregulator ArsR/SmtB family transcription factor [Capsulimonas sp.]|uniref:ArsR/SmtB family transcription factor n=1 Tax=Capsulimonas sp. TaxID=2494211 RepID=UPI00326395A8
MEEIILILKALADPTRLEVFQCIRGCGGSAGYDIGTGMCDGGTEGGVAVCDVKCKVPCAPSTLTHHLNVLRDAGLIETQKRGRVVYACVRAEAIQKIAAFFAPETK